MVGSNQMFALSEYVIDQEIHENKRIRVFRGRNAQDGSPVVIKALKEEASGPSELYRLIYEYEISRNLEAEGVIKPLWLEQEGMFFALIMEDIGAVSLREYMQNRSVSPEDFLDIAIQLAQTLGDIHQQGILHRERPEDDPGSDRRGKERRAFQSGGPLCGQNPGNRDVKRQRTGERLGGGAYVTQSGAKSLACLPILFREIPAGVLYLENSLLEGVFTPERLELLKLLSAQLISAKKLQAYLEGEPEGKNSTATGLIEPLTARETEVLQLIAGGMSNPEIADRLGLTANTVKGYIKNIYGKLGANRRVQVVARARELGLLSTKQAL